MLPNDYDEYAQPKLTGKYAHYCWEWDGLRIDETCAEFFHCTCFPETKEIADIRAKLKKELDKEWEQHHAENDGVIY